MLTADYSCVDNFGNTAWDYARVRQMHYCLLIVASYIRQKAKNQTGEAGRSLTYHNGGGDTSRVLDYEDFGINHLQVRPFTRIIAHQVRREKMNNEVKADEIVRDLDEL